MWRVIWFFLGVTRLQVTGASPEWCLQRLAKARVPFHFCGKTGRLHGRDLDPAAR